MGRSGLREKLLATLSADTPRSAKEIVKATRLDKKKVWDGLAYWWERGLLLRSETPNYEVAEVFKGRRGYRKNTRAYYLYLLKTGEKESAQIKGRKFVAFKEEHRDARGARGASKAQLIVNYLSEHSERAFFSSDIAQALADRGVKPRDIMATVRRYGDSVYIRGYRTDQRQTPFKEGYLLTWIDKSKPREQALEEAIQRTDAVLDKRSSSNPVVERIHQIRDIVIESTKLRDLVGVQFLQGELGCTENEADKAVDRAMQLYPDLKGVKLFNAYRYLYHASMAEEDLTAAKAMKENYIRVVKGRDNRVGHNWEAVPEWFIDTFTTGARFWTQQHRTDGIDSRRITIHLMKPVGGRRQNAEVDRVWEVTPGVFAQPITYVLECKWGLVKKKYVDDFFEVLRWSKEFGVDTPEGRQVRQGVLGVFAASSFDPKESVLINDQTLSLPSYAARMNIQLLKAADFNQKLRDRGVDENVTVQSICRVSKDENQVREMLEAVWKEVTKAQTILIKTASENEKMFAFEKMLKGAKDSLLDSS